MGDSRSIIINLINEISKGFVGRDEEAKVSVLALVTRQHAVFIGEPGTAKSALIKRLSQLISSRFFYYLLSKYTVPDEIIGPIDPIKYKEGKFVRNIQGRLPTAEIAFIDEVFKGSSETLNTLLSIMNERVFIDADGTIYSVPLWSMYGASNEVPSDSELAAFYDRFLIKHFVRRIDSSRLEQAIISNINNLNSNIKPICSLREIETVYNEVSKFMIENATAVAKVVSNLVIVLRQNGIFVSDRTAVSNNHLPRLVATYAYVFNTDLRKAALAVSKYVLPSYEAFEAYKRALDSLMPPEIREAEEKLDKARDHAISGDLATAKRLAAEAVQIAQLLFSKPEKIELFKDEVKEIVANAEKLVEEITRIEEELKKFKKK